MVRGSHSVLLSRNARVVELVYTLVLGTNAERIEGSNPSVGIMTQEKLQQICNEYLEAVDASGFGIIEAKCLSDEYQSQPRYDLYVRDILGHLKYMFQEIPKLDTPDKQGRWLGWAQGLIWMFGLETLKAQRERNR